MIFLGLACLKAILFFRQQKRRFCFLAGRTAGRSEEPEALLDRVLWSLQPLVRVLSILAGQGAASFFVLVLAATPRREGASFCAGSLVSAE